MNESLSLRAATVQEIQLELLRRTSFNALDEEWAGEVYVYENQEEIDSALGTGRDEYGLLSVWWD